MTFNTWLTEELSIQYPIVQGAMQWLSRAELASAVSNAGGLGIITAGSFFTAEELRQEIRKMRSLTDKPFAVNFTLMPTSRPIVWEEYINVSLEEDVSIIETSGRNPERYMEWLRSAKVKLLHKVARIRDALTAEKLGVDAVTIVGCETGGHPGMEDVASLVLIPRAVDLLKIPVLAGGGFADGRGLVAALALGAQGVVMGTRFMTSQECPLHPRIKELLLQSRETDTMMVERSIKNAARVLKTNFSQKVLEIEKRGTRLKELFPMLDGQRVKRAFENGDTNDSLIYCGQVVGMIDSLPSVREIIEGIIGEARKIIERLVKMGLNL